MNTIKKNFAYNAIYQILVIILPIVTAPFVSRVLGPTKMGQYSYTYSIATYFLLIAKLGFDNYGNRSIARIRSSKGDLDKTFSGIYYLQFIIAFSIMCLYSIYVLFISKYSTLALMQGLWVLGALFDINWFFYGLEEFSIIILRNTLVKIISIVLIFCIVRGPNDLWKYTLILSASSVAGFLITWPFVFSKVKLVKIQLKEIFSHFRQTILLFIPVIAISVFTILDKIMLGYMSSFTQVGYFEAAEKVMMAPKGIIGALGTVMLPRMANLYSSGDNKNKRVFIDLSVGFALVFSIGCMFGIMGVAETFVPIFFGPKYLATTMILKIMAIVLPFYAIGNVVRTQLLIPNMRDKPYINSVVFGAIVNVTLNFVLIPKLGARGTVIATIVAEIVIAVFQLLAVLRELKPNYFVMTVLYSLFSSGTMLFVIFLVKVILGNSLLSLLLQIVIGGMTFAITFILISSKSSDVISTKMVNTIIRKK